MVCFLGCQAKEMRLIFVLSLPCIFSIYPFMSLDLKKTICWQVVSSYRRPEFLCTGVVVCLRANI